MDYYSNLNPINGPMHLKNMLTAITSRKIKEKNTLKEITKSMHADNYYPFQ